MHTAEMRHWQMDVPLLATPVILRQMTIVLLVPLALLTLLLTGLAWWEGNLEDLAAILQAVLGVAGILCGLFLITSLLFFRNRMRMQFEITPDGIRSTVIDSRARTGRMLAIVFGALARNPTVAGAGLLAQSGASRFTPWQDIVRIEADRRRHTLLLKGRRMTIDAIFCTPENYAAVKAAMEEATGR